MLLALLFHLPSEVEAAICVAGNEANRFHERSPDPLPYGRNVRDPDVDELTGMELTGQLLRMSSIDRQDSRHYRFRVSDDLVFDDIRIDVEGFHILHPSAAIPRYRDCEYFIGLLYIATCSVISPSGLKKYLSNDR